MIFVLSLFFIPNVFGLGLSPAAYTTIFSPNLEQTYNLTILGEKEPFDIKLFVNGELKEYIELPGENFTVPPQNLTLKYKIKLPEKLENGTYKTSIVVEKQEVEGHGTVGPKIALGQVIVVKVFNNNEKATKPVWTILLLLLGISILFFAFVHRFIFSTK